MFCCVALISAASAGELRLHDNTRVNAVIEGLAERTPPALRVTQMDGVGREIPLEDITSIGFRGREQRLLLSGTQELRFLGGDTLRGRLLGCKDDHLQIDSYTLGEAEIDLGALKGFLTLPQLGHAGRQAAEMIELPARENEHQFMDIVVDRRGSAYEGIVRHVSKDELEIGHEPMLRIVPIPVLYLAGVRLADSGRNTGPAFPSTVLLRVITRDGSRLTGRLEKIELGRWTICPLWSPETRLPIVEEEIVTAEILNGKRLYLSQLQPKKIEEHTADAPPQPFKLDRSCQGDPLTIARRTLPFGIGVHANSALTFQLGKAFKTFQSTIGIDGHSGDRGNVVFTVLGDGKVLYQSPTLRGDSTPAQIAVPIDGVEELTLKVTAGGENDFGDLANWAAPQLLR